jgi:hypothetical protein
MYHSQIYKYNNYMKKLFLILVIFSGMGLVACGDATAEASAEETTQDDVAQDNNETEGESEVAALEVE